MKVPALSRTTPWHVAILIPARDEEVLLPRCLASVQTARLRLPSHITSDIVVVSDCSTDRTEEKARRMLVGKGAVVRTEAGLVGAARAEAARVALTRHEGPRDRCWLANTDADCEVPEEWLLQHLAIADRGIPAVAGIVDVDSFHEHSPSVEELFRLTYILHEDGTHPHVHGANLGVRADAYLHAGGWRDLHTAEDHDLWDRLRKSGHQPVADARLLVTTSGRRHGRAPRGFADALAAHNGSAA